MPEKLVTHDVPPDIESTGFSAENIVSTLAADNTAEIAMFETARDHAKVAEYVLGVLLADLERHLLSLNQNIRIRTAQGQAALSITDLERLMHELQAVGRSLLEARDGAEPQQEAD